MAENDLPWTTVGKIPPHIPYDRIWQFQQEVNEQAVIKSWDRDETWPSAHKPLLCGPDAKRFDARFIRLSHLGAGAFGSVEKVAHGSVPLARKRIVRRRGISIEELRQEALTMRKLDHRHIVKLVATYSPRAHELCLIIWPAAVCNLKDLLEDVECLRQDEGDREDIIERLNALDIKDLSAIDHSPTPQYLDSSARCPLEFLRTVIGCIARALAYCHANDVRHLDIKPSNILLKADRVYLADFGISRDVSGQDHTSTEGAPGSERWRAPELYSNNGASMQLADIYSLGLVYLNIATVLYNARLSDFDEALAYSCHQNLEDQIKNREEKLKVHLQKLAEHARVTPPFMFTREGRETVRPRPLVNIIACMIAAKPQSRLPMNRIDERLSMLGGVHQIYHGSCCKRPISWVEDKWDNKLRALTKLQEENELQRKRIEELEAKDRTYEERVENARRRRDEEVNKLRSRLEELEEKCRQLEETKGRRGMGRQASGTSLPVVGGSSTARSCAALGLSPARSQSSPVTPTSRPRLQQTSHSAQRFMSYVVRSSSGQANATPSPVQSPLSVQRGTGTLDQRSPSLTNLAGYALRSRGSGSKLPLPVTPNRTGTPPISRDSSSTDSSLASSVLSRRSVETIPTPAPGSPALVDDESLQEGTRDQPDPGWGALPERSPSVKQRRPSTPELQRVPYPSNRTSQINISSPTASFSQSRRSSSLAAADDSTLTVRTTGRPPTLPSALSWAEVAKIEKKSRR